MIFYCCKRRIESPFADALVKNSEKKNGDREGVGKMNMEVRELVGEHCCDCKAV